MRSIINNTKCAGVLNCKQRNINSVLLCQSDTGVSLNHIYITNTTLIKLSAGSLNITSSWNEVLNCSEECLILIEKNQTLSISCSEIDNHLDFKVIDIPYNLMSKMYSLFLSESKPGTMLSMKKDISSRMLSSPLSPGMNEAFDNVFDCLRKVERSECGDCTGCHSESEGSPLDFTLMFLLSAFTTHEDGIGILSRTLKSSLREKTFNIINSDPSRPWNLDDVAINLYMSRSTLKRKLAAEGTSFSEIYLNARMHRAAKLLRTGDHNINQVAVMCGYNRPSFFITTFRKYFQMTPYTFMKLTNH
ncbi:helix-turn-helix domain-containing protein [Salmonella enterica]|nr:helix-turn-helix domain-containing protein [Salmonella enterica]EAX4060316.1 helix-turn-helix domain-containing protein [Salmonella enterica]EDW9231065.1 helix-turn-helix domain-containing protein [Salmonella enterica]